MRSRDWAASLKAWRRARPELWAPSGAGWSRNLPRIGASAILITYLVTLVLAHLAGQRPADLGLRLTPCGESTCVGWVMPAGFGWYRGARPGMRVVSVSDGEHPNEAALEAPDGRTLSVRVAPDAMVGRGAELFLGLAGVAFALLAAAVLVRRPGSPAARWFSVFAGLAAVALGVAPASGGPHPGWA